MKDERIALARAITSRKGRLEHRKMLLPGEEILDWAIQRNVHVEYVLLSDKSPPAIADKYLSRGLRVFAASDGILRKAVDGSHVVPVIGVGRILEGEGDVASDFVVVIDGVKDFGNIGTIVRTCQAFGIRRIVSTTIDFDIYQRKTIEASRGCVFATAVESFENPGRAVEKLKKRGYQIVATSPKGGGLQSLVELKEHPVALVVGSETTGISRDFEEHADFLIQIPMYHTVESLNVGVAAGISIYELRLKQVLTMIEERIKSTLGRELNVAGTLVRQVLDGELKKATDLSSQQVIFMMVLRCDRRMEMGDMCRQFGVLQGEAEEFLAPMLNAGLIVRDGELELTKKGEEILAKLWFVVESTEGKILSDLPSEEASALIRQLRRIQGKCMELITAARP